MEVCARIQLQILVRHNCRHVVIDRPVWPKYVQWLREHIIVDKARVHGVQTHQQNDITAPKEDVPDLANEKHTHTQLSVNKTSETKQTKWSQNFCKCCDSQVKNQNKYLTVRLLGCKRLLTKNHPSSKCCHYHSVSKVAKHHSKQKWECNNCVWSWKTNIICMVTTLSENC